MNQPPPSAGQHCAWPVIVDPVFFCWRWRGRKDRDGYGTHSGQGSAHRMVYEAERGPIPEGMMLDHRCRRRDCVNPNHLEPVSQSTNERRKRWSHRTKLKTCKAGHDLYEHGRRTPEGGHVCCLCK